MQRLLNQARELQGSQYPYYLDTPGGRYLFKVLSEPQPRLVGRFEKPDKARDYFDCGSDGKMNFIGPDAVQQVEWFLSYLNQLRS